MARYLVKAGHRPRGRNSVVVADELMVEHPILFRQLETRDSPIGPIGRSEPTGKRDARRFRFVVREGTLGTGSKASRSRCQAETATAAASVKKVVRALRPQEEEKLDALDQQRRDLLDQLDALENQRDELVREAFSRGNVVRVGDLEQMAAATEREVEERKQLLNSLPDLSVEELHKMLESPDTEEYVAHRIRGELGNR